VRQVKNSIDCHSPHLKKHQQEVWNLIKKFEAFNIISVPQNINIEESNLANATSHLGPLDGDITDKFCIELNFRPSILDNIIKWRGFNDDKHIIDFQTCKGTFQNDTIDDEEYAISL